MNFTTSYFRQLCTTIPSVPDLHAALRSVCETTLSQFPMRLDVYSHGMDADFIDFGTTYKCVLPFYNNQRCIGLFLPTHMWECTPYVSLLVFTQFIKPYQESGQVPISPDDMRFILCLQRSIRETFCKIRELLPQLEEGSEGHACASAWIGNMVWANETLCSLINVYNQARVRESSVVNTWYTSPMDGCGYETCLEVPCM
jgi:hypothetical protein